MLSVLNKLCFPNLPMEFHVFLPPFCFYALGGGILEGAAAGPVIEGPKLSASNNKTSQCVYIYTCACVCLCVFLYMHYIIYIYICDMCVQ